MQQNQTPVALITGACGGIGSVTAQAFARSGYRLALFDRDVNALSALAATLTAEGADCETFAADVTDPEALARAFAHARERAWSDWTPPSTMPAFRAGIFRWRR